MKHLLIVMLMLPLMQARSADLYVAVASSFKPALQNIVMQFEQQTDHNITLSSASSGQLFAQIKHGARYDIFFSADAERPITLAHQRPELGNSTNYAYGQLALYSIPPIACENWQYVLSQAKPKDIAIANPKLAPYGLAAEQVLTSINKTLSKMPTASNAAIPLNWLHSGNIKHVLSAYSFAANIKTAASICLLPKALYTPIEHHFLALNNRQATQQLAAFIQSTAAQTVLRDNGYLVAHHD